MSLIGRDVLHTTAQFLLGSPPVAVISQLGVNSPHYYRDILRASAASIHEVYDARWTRGHKMPQQHK